MEIKNLGTLIVVFTLLVIGAVNVEGAVCSPDSCTPSCEWVIPASNNVEHLTDEFEGNTTMAAGVKEGTTSGFYNGTYWTITPYHNSTTSQNITGNSVSELSAIFDNLDDATYTLTATIYYFNETSSIDQNLTLTEADCSSRQFTVDTSQGSIIPFVAEFENIAEEIKPVGLTEGVGLIILLGAVWIFFFNKK